MRVLDLFCCEGGAAAGYARAGFEVVGVDMAARCAKWYPYEFHQGDALAFALEHGREFDLIHASPPCQGYTRGNAGKETKWPKLIPAVREVLRGVGVPFVIENVEDAAPHMIAPVSLCGCMFNLTTPDADGTMLHLRRVRLFETSWLMVQPQHTTHRRDIQWAGAYGGARRDKTEARTIRKGGYVPPDKDVVKRLLGIEHDMTWKGLFECLPPAFTEYVGHDFKEVAAA